METLNNLLIDLEKLLEIASEENIRKNIRNAGDSANNCSQCKCGRMVSAEIASAVKELGLELSQIEASNLHTVMVGKINEVKKDTKKSIDALEGLGYSSSSMSKEELMEDMMKRLAEAKQQKHKKDDTKRQNQEGPQETQQEKQNEQDSGERGASKKPQLFVDTQASPAIYHVEDMQASPANQQLGNVSKDDPQEKENDQPEPKQLDPQQNPQGVSPSPQLIGTPISPSDSLREQIPQQGQAQDQEENTEAQSGPQFTDAELPPAHFLLEKVCKRVILHTCLLAGFEITSLLPLASIHDIDSMEAWLIRIEYLKTLLEVGGQMSQEDFDAVVMEGFGRELINQKYDEGWHIFGDYLVSSFCPEGYLEFLLCICFLSRYLKGKAPKEGISRKELEEEIISCVDMRCDGNEYWCDSAIRQKYVDLLHQETQNWVGERYDEAINAQPLSPESQKENKPNSAEIKKKIAEWDAHFGADEAWLEIRQALIDAASNRDVKDEVFDKTWLRLFLRTS